MPRSFLFSFAFVVAFNALAAAIATPTPERNPQGLQKCLKIHPVRYCRIANGYHVESLYTIVEQPMEVAIEVPMDIID